MTATHGAFLLLPALLLAALPAGAAQDACEDRRPKITVTAVKDSDRFYIEDYGNVVSIFCTSPESLNVTISSDDDGKCLQTVKLNNTTVQTMQKRVGDYRYTCTDGATGCDDYLYVRVRPSLWVSSPRARWTLDIYGERKYFVPLGDKSYDVFCSSNDGASHKMKQLDPWVEKLNADAVNITTTKYRARADHVTDTSYQCVLSVPRNDYLYNSFSLTVDHYPMAQMFRCILYNFHKLMCSWSSSTTRNTFKLFFTTKNHKNPIFLTADNTQDANITCVWANIYEGKPLILSDEKFSLLLETCNEIFCDNQTFPVYSNSITKINPVVNLRVSNTYSSGTILQWRLRLGCDNSTFKVDYRLVAIGEEWRQADTSSSQHDRIYCTFHLTRLYPASQYEVRVYARLKAATDDWLWSDPASISLETKPSETCACTAPPREPSAPVTPSEASCEACELKEHTIEDYKAFTKRKIGLRRRRDYIHRYAKVLNDLQSTLALGTSDP